MSARAFCLVLLISSIGLAGCVNRPWPASPLYAPPANLLPWRATLPRGAALAALAGHYAHYDVVAYEAQVPAGAMRTFIITYGFTDLRLENGKLVEYDRFCHAAHKINQDVQTAFDDAATQAIVPRSTPVEVTAVGEQWHLRRPATPTLVGIDGDWQRPLSRDPHDPRINDADGDGKPGVTVHLKLAGMWDAELYIARREIFQYNLMAYGDGSLRGHVVDSSEQLVIGSSFAPLAQQNDPKQHADPGLSPILLMRVPDSMTTCEQLMAARDGLFPAEPAFH